MIIYAKPLANVFLASCLALSLAAASAAEPVGSIARIQGSALINQGEHYIAAREGMPVRPGDILLVVQGSDAVIKFEDGCLYTLTDNQVLTIGTGSTCAAGGAVASYMVNPHPASIPAGGLTILDAAAGAVAVASVVALASQGDGGGNNFPPAGSPPISP